MKRKKPIHRKRTGHIGPIKVTANAKEPTLSWERIKFPEVKEEIELYAVQRFAMAIQKNGATIIAVTQNAENHFDFTLALPGGHHHESIACSSVSSA